MIRKRLLSACLALALCLSLLPATALAEENAPTTLYVRDQRLPVGPDSCWTTDANTGKLTEYTTGGDEWTVKYEPTSATLTLKNATIKGVVNTENIASAGIYAASSSGPVSLNIVLVGENEVTGGYGINVSSEGAASLSITGSGSLTVSATAANGIGIFVQAQSDANLTIDGANVNAVVTETNGRGVELSTGQAGNPNLTIEVKGGSLQASGQPNGIKFFTNADNTRADANLKVSGNAMVKTSGITTDADGSGSQGAVLTTEAGSGETGGIVWNGKNGTVYGDVTLQEDLEIGEGESLTIPDGSSLDMNGHTITVESGGKLDGKPTGEGTVKIAPTITTESLPDGEVGTVYSQTLTATGDPTITWNVTSDTLPAGLTLDTKTGTISGTPTAQGTSNFTVTATNDYGSDSKEFTLTIDQQGTIHVTSVSLDKTSLELTEGGTGTLIATVEPNNATNRNVTWESSNTSVATVDANGLVTAVSAGTATITATAEDGRKTATCTVTVKPAEYTVTVQTDGKGSASASAPTAAAGTTVTLTAKPDSGYRLARWEVVEGDVTITGNRFIMPAENVTVRAVFSPIVNLPDTYDIDLIVGEGGEARLSLTNASEGSTITVTATPDEGFKLDYITVDGERIDGTTFTVPAHDVTVRVYFTDDAALPFTDVSAGAWYFDAVGYVYVGGLMDGVSDTLFDPDGTMTRAMVWAILARVDGETVTGEDWIETAREWAMSEGVSDGENANGYVTREQLATMLYRYAVYKGYDVSIGEDTNILSYDDFADLSEYAIPAMQWACGAGVITGVTDATLVPQGEATRAQVAAMLMRFVEAIG